MAIIITIANKNVVMMKIMGNKIAKAIPAIIPVNKLFFTMTP